MIKIGIVEINGEKYYPLLEWEGLYCISKKGIVLSLPKNRSKNPLENEYYIMGVTWKKNQAKTKRYAYVGLSSTEAGRKPVAAAIHKLVAKQFLPNTNNYKYVCFKDGNTENYSVENLFWSKASVQSGNIKIKNGLKYMRGVSYNPANTKRPFMAQYHYNNKLIYIGAYKTEEEAHKAYKDAIKKHIQSIKG